MNNFELLDIAVIVLFFSGLFATGFMTKLKSNSTEEYLLSGRNLTLVLFVLTNVATWYGGILGVGEFTYKYGLVSWFTQGFPYYIFAIIFAFLFAGKIRESNLFTIPDKIEKIYGKKVALLAAIIVFILVSPAPYILMISELLKFLFGIDTVASIIIAVFISVVYLFKGGYKSDVYTDAYQFFFMFLGFIIIFITLISNHGGFGTLVNSLPESYLTITGNASPAYILVWFFIALWTFTDPGFHQRSYAAKSPSIAKYGIIISVLFWILFDFLTTSTGLFTRALMPNLKNPVFAFPLLAEKILSPGLKGLFYAALFATIISTLNSYLFISATTFGRDLIYRLKGEENKVPSNTRIGLAIAALFGAILAYSINSIIELWYLIGSVCIPGMLFLVVSSYYPKFKIDKNLALFQTLFGSIISLAWYFLRNNFQSTISEIEPMIVGLIFVTLIHSAGMLRIKREKIELKN